MPNASVGSLIPVLSVSQFHEIARYYPQGEESSMWNSLDGIALSGAQPDPVCHRAICIISRLPRVVNAEDPWLASTSRAVKFVALQGYVFISSVGGIGWEFTAWRAAGEDLSLWIITPPGKIEDFRHTIDDAVLSLKLNPARTTFIMPLSANKIDKAATLRIRDRLAWSLAHHRIPVAIRKGGLWSEVTADAPNLIRDFQCLYPNRILPRWQKQWEKMESFYNPALDGMLIHWTRGAYGPWEGELRADYFDALLAAESGNPRDGFATLKHIAGCGVLRGSSRMTRGEAAVVSFAAVGVESMLRKIRYRTSLGRWNYEPYGIAVRCGSLKKLGGKPVIYGDKSDYDRLDEADKPFFQYKGARGLDWRGEGEWRLAGDLDLWSLKDEVLLIVPTLHEAAELRSSLPYEVLALFG